MLSGATYMRTIAFEGDVLLCIVLRKILLAICFAVLLTALQFDKHVKTREYIYYFSVHSRIWDWSLFSHC